MNSPLSFGIGESSPPGWNWVRLADACKLETGHTPSRRHPEYWDGEVDWVSISDVNDSEIYIGKTSERITQDGIANSAARMLPAETVLMSRGPTIGKVCILPRPMTTNQSFIAWVDKGNIDPLFLYFLLKAGRDTLEERGSGATMHTIYMPDVENLWAVVPDRTAQKRIASRIINQLNAVDLARIAAREQLTISQDLAHSFIHSLLAGPKKQPHPIRTIGEAAKIQTGYAFKSEWFSKSGIRLLRNANIFHGFISWEDEVRLPVERQNEFADFAMNEGDIVLTLDRPIISTGLKVARISKMDLPSLLLQRVARFKPNPLIDESFLYLFLRSPQFLQSIKGHDQSLGVPHISPKQVAAAKMPLPQKAEQLRIVARANEILATCEELQKHCDELQSAVELLTASVLRSEFCRS